MTRDQTECSTHKAQPRDRVTLIWLALILALALLVRWLLTQGERIVWGDEPFYLWLGRNWITGRGFQFVGHSDVHHGPLFPMLAGLLYLVTGDMARASAWIYIVCGAGLVLPVYALGRDIYGRRVGLYAAALVAVLPALTISILNWGSLTEPLYMLLVYLGLWAGLRMLRPLWAGAEAGAYAQPWWPFALAGLAFGLAYLTRPEAVNYVVVLGLFWAWMALQQGRWRKVTIWAHGMLVVLGFAAAFVPYAVHVHAQTGAWMVSEKIGVAYLTGIGLAHGDTAAFDRSTWGLDASGLETFFFSSDSYNVSMTQLILDDPRTFATVLYLNAQTFVRVLIDWTLLPYAALPLLTLGLFGNGWAPKRLRQELYLLASMLPVVSFVLFFIQARYLVAAIPVFLLWMAVGLEVIRAWGLGTVAALHSGEAWARSQRLWQGVWGLVPVLMVLALLVAAYPMVTAKVRNVGSVRQEHKLLGEALAPYVTPDTVIMSRYPAIAFHAGAAWTPTPNAEIEQVTRYARHKGADYFVIDEAELRYRPQFRPLYAGQQTPSGMNPVAAGEPEDGLIVFRLPN